MNEGILGGAFHPKARLLGYALLFRLQGRNCGRFAPFFDFGAGIQDTTLDRHAPEISGSLQFSPQGGPGAAYFFSPRRALVIQYRYLHMSNAGIQAPNHGFNASMLSVGFRWLRGPRPAGWQASHHSRNPFQHLVGRR